MSNTIKDLIEIIKLRKKDNNIKKSYTALLLSSGLNKCIDKMTEEFDEFKQALKNKDNEIHECADLLFHILVSLESAGVNFDDVISELKKRKKQSGIEEKINR